MLPCWGTHFRETLFYRSTLLDFQFQNPDLMGHKTRPETMFVIVFKSLVVWIFYIFGTEILMDL